jgi:hypothetical protein
VIASKTPFDLSGLVPETTVRARPAVTWRELDGEAVLLDLEHGRYFTLNRAGSRLWRTLGKRRTLSSLQQDLVENFDVDAETAWNDLVELVRDLDHHALVVLDRA